MFRAEREQQSERSDAGEMIVPEVFGFVNGKYTESIRSEAKAFLRGFGVQGKGAASPFIPCFLDIEEEILGDRFS